MAIESPLLHAPSNSSRGISKKVALTAALCLGVIVASAFFISGQDNKLASMPRVSARAALTCPRMCGMPTVSSIGQATRRLPNLRGGAMTEIAKGVSFDTVAREWRMKWSPDADKASLVKAQEALDEVLTEVKAIPGVKSVQRVVCGGCLDFKVVTSLEADKFGDWEGSEFSPEKKFLEKVKGIDGISFVETQTYTLMPM
eukprot:CAMPEP_0167774982 /NCGR_PEP_ID=MMETSP0111_2-20121227/2300_1 /TAXON_ID=91324 /ORGANISM="Lotharella globosa, Strain CCCM811" /LENGTH=199 /DNA_ID=CAMNT_0007664835 /DNA_START=38 /DNA_END=637 /DNA_ORIENTATION=-